MWRRLLAGGAAALSLFAAARANPDGAPWGAANPAAEQNCSSCHFDNTAITGSSTISLSGLPEKIYAGEAYIIVLTFVSAGAVKAGFLLSSDVGEFKAGGEFLVSRGSEIRSIVPKAADGEVKWSMLWRTPEKLDGDITFYVAVNAGNDDQSPFGDQIHYRSFTRATD